MARWLIVAALVAGCGKDEPRPAKVEPGKAPAPAAAASGATTRGDDLAQMQVANEQRIDEATRALAAASNGEERAQARATLAALQQRREALAKLRAQQRR